MKVFKFIIIISILFYFERNNFIASAQTIPQNDSLNILKDSAAYYVQLGKIASDSNKYTIAWKYYEKALKIDSNNYPAVKGIYIVCSQMHKMGPATKALEKMVVLRPENTQNAFKLVRLNFDYGQWEKTISLAKALNHKDPSITGLSYLIGRSYYSLEEYGMGLTFLLMSIKETETPVDVYYYLGRMYMLMSNYAKADENYHQYFQLDSTANADRHYEYALLLSNINKFNDAISQYEITLNKGYKTNTDFYTNYAYTLSDAKRADEAIEIFNNILAKRPDDMSLLQTIGDVCSKNGKYEKSIEYYDKILALDDKNGRVLYQIGKNYIKMGKEDMGKKLCDKAIEMDPSLSDLKREKKMN